MGTLYQGSVQVSGNGSSKSPYEYAVENGYTGSEQEFIQLLVK